MSMTEQGEIEIFHQLVHPKNGHKKLVHFPLFPSYISRERGRKQSKRDLQPTPYRTLEWQTVASRLTPQQWPYSYSFFKEPYIHLFIIVPTIHYCFQNDYYSKLNLEFMQYIITNI